MGSRGKDQGMPHQPLLSSLVVRATDSGGGGASGVNDYESGEVFCSNRFSDNPGYRIRADSGSPVRRRNADRRYSPDFDRRVGLPRGRGFGNRRSPGRFRDISPPYGRGRGRGGRLLDRGFDGPGFGPGPFRGDGLPRNNPNVRPREGDWMCPDPACNNLNFARRDHCNNCNMYRYPPQRRGRGGYLGPPPPPRRFPGPPPPPVDRSPPRRPTNGSFRSPPRGWARDSPREFGTDGGPLPHLRYEGRFPNDYMRRGRMDSSPPEDHRGERSSKFDRPMPPLDLGNRDSGSGRDQFFNERKGYDDERLPPSPPLLLPSMRSPLRPPSRWERDVRERSRSPIRGGPQPPPPKDYRRDMYVERGRDGMGRDQIDDLY